MIDKDELLFVVDENNKPLEPKPRTYVHKNKLWHRTTGIWVINFKGQVLCQKRSLKKDIKPGFWEAFFGGHVESGEDWLENAAKEVEEELGVTVRENSLFPYRILKSNKPDHKEFQYIFGLILEKDLEGMNFEKEEIDELKWLGFRQLEKILIERRDRHWVKKRWDKDVLTWLSTLTRTN